MINNILLVHLVLIQNYKYTLKKKTPGKEDPFRLSCREALRPKKKKPRVYAGTTTPKAVFGVWGRMHQQARIAK